MSIISNFFDFYHRKIEPGLKIKDSALVVDLGSGDKPFWRADVFVDDLSIGNNHRATRSKTIKTLGTFVNADLVNLPFANNTFDFSYASHVIEHIDNPDKALKEIMRVSKSGYLEFPNGFFEMLSPAPGHLWCIFTSNKGLTFMRKSKDVQRILFANKSLNSKIAESIESPFISFYWKKKIRYTIIDVKKSDKFNAKIEKFTKTDHFKKIPLYLILIKAIRYALYKNKEIPYKIYKKNEDKS